MLHVFSFIKRAFFFFIFLKKNTTPGKNNNNNNNNNEMQEDTVKEIKSNQNLTNQEIASQYFANFFA